MSTQPSPQSTLQNLSKSLNCSETELLLTARKLGLNPKQLSDEDILKIKAELQPQNNGKVLKGDAIATPKPEEPAETPDDLVAPGTFSLACEEDALMDATDKAIDDTVDQINDNIDNMGNFKLGLANERIEQASLEGSLQGYLEVAAFENSANAAFLEGLSQLAQVRANAHKQSLAQYSELFQKLGKDTRPNVEETIRNHAATAQKEAQTNQEIRSKFNAAFQKKTWVKTATK